MNKNAILWIVSAVIIFVFGLAHSVVNQNFPISGTIGIEGKKITYLFPKTTQADEPYSFIIRNDHPSVTGYFIFDAGNGKKEKVELKKDKELLTGIIGELPPGTKINYSVFLRYGDKTTQVPYNTEVTTLVTGKTGVIIDTLYPFMLFLGLLLAVRGGLEYFNPNPKFRLYALMPAMVFICFGFFVIPVKNFLLLAPPPGVILQPSQMFSFESIFYPLFWIGITILVFFKIKPGLMLLSGSVITILAFMFLG